MNVNVVYPVPLDAWDTFRPHVAEFCRTWQEFPPGAPCTLVCVCRGGLPQGDQLSPFIPLGNVRFVPYDGNGFDIGAHQYFAFQAGDAFNVNVSTRVFFHRPGWLAKLLESRHYFGPGLFGTAVSVETGVLHFRTHCYGIDAPVFRRYPDLINSRERTFEFEHARNNHPRGSFLQWAMNQGDLAAACVYWDGGWRPSEWFNRPNIWRKGDESNLLVFDHHTRSFLNSPPGVRDFLSRATGTL